MKRFGPGPGSGGFSALLRSAGHKGIQRPVNNHQPGAMPEKGGSSGNRTPNNAATQRHMDAKNSPARQGRVKFGGTRKAQQADPPHRIARGSAGTTGREIHFPNEMERPTRAPAPYLIGANRTKTSKGGTVVKEPRARMSTEVKGRPGVPGHQSVINRGMKPHGGYMHRKSVASKLQW